MGLTWPMATGLARLRLRTLLVRLPQRLTHGFVLPLVLIATVRAGAKADDAARLAFAAAFLSACFMMMRAPAAGLTEERVSGVHRLLGAVGGVSPSATIAAHAVGLVALAIPPSVLFVAVAFWTGSPAGAGWPVPLALTYLALNGLGMGFVGPRVSALSLLLITDVTTTALMVFSPLLYPIEAVPAGLATLTRWLPSTAATDATVRLWHGDAAGWAPTVYLAAWALALSIWGYRRFPS